MSAEITIAPSETTPSGAKGEKSIFGTGVSAPITLKTDVLRTNLAGFVSSLSEALQGLPEVIEGFRLDEIEVVVEVNAEGSIQLLGGVKVGASGGISLKLKR